VALQKAPDRVREKHFDGIVSDVNMPVMDGIEFFSAVSSHRQRRQLQINSDRVCADEAVCS
jgi:CheY-like chemotaxis protein